MYAILWCILVFLLDVFNKYITWHESTSMQYEQTLNHGYRKSFNDVEVMCLKQNCHLFQRSETTKVKLHNFGFISSPQITSKTISLFYTKFEHSCVTNWAVLMGGWEVVQLLFMHSRAVLYKYNLFQYKVFEIFLWTLTWVLI